MYFQDKEASLNKHRFLHFVHYKDDTLSFNEDSSRDEEEEFSFTSSISFKEMVAQANAQSDHYTVEEEDEWDPY